ncbi:MAG: hypothetical protein L0I76_19285 [Pseudonocardia sp.]|nr:hypothetical protein [Pseudonocardia sp.]
MTEFFNPGPNPHRNPPILLDRVSRYPPEPIAPELLDRAAALLQDRHDRDGSPLPGTRDGDRLASRISR